MSADNVGPRAVAELVEMPTVRVGAVPLAGHVAHVLQPAHLLLDEHAVPRRFRRRAAQRARVQPVHGRIPASAAAPVPPLQPQRRQPGGRPAPDQHVVVVRVGAATQVVQRAACRGRQLVQPQLPQLARGHTLVKRTGHRVHRTHTVAYTYIVFRTPYGLSAKTSPTVPTVPDSARTVQDRRGRSRMSLSGRPIESTFPPLTRFGFIVNLFLCSKNDEKICIFLQRGRQCARLAPSTLRHNGTFRNPIFFDQTASTACTL